MGDNNNQDNYNVLQYPEGVERAKNEMLGFLPDDDNVKEGFMKDLLQFLIQW